MPGLCRYLKEVAVNIRGHRQFLMTPTALPPISPNDTQNTPKILPKTSYYPKGF